MRFRSPAMQRAYRHRRPLVAERLDGAMCDRCDRARATDVHEVVSRARGGSILERTNLANLCRDCHRWVTTHPAAAAETGWLDSPEVHGFAGDDYRCDRCGQPRVSWRHVQEGDGQ